MYFNFCTYLLVVETLFTSEGFADCKLKFSIRTEEGTRQPQIISTACLWNWLCGFPIPLSNWGYGARSPGVKRGCHEADLTCPPRYDRG